MLLRDEGGWASISMVERYAHLMPREMVADIAIIWGASHPRLGDLPTRTAPDAVRKSFKKERLTGDQIG